MFMPLKRHRVFHVGDLVRIKNPRFVERVGYPNSLQHYIDQVEAKFSKEITQLIHSVKFQETIVSVMSGRMSVLRYNDRIPRLNLDLTRDSKAYKRIVSELAHEMAIADSFGGRERSIHFVERPEMMDWEGSIKSIRTVKTGIYTPAYGSSTMGDDDFMPAGLSNEKTHRLATLSGNGCFGEIPVEHLEKIGAEARKVTLRLV